jgi:hypothetical protein
MESGSIKSWACSGLKGVRKSTNDAAPASLRNKILYKAILYGKKAVLVDWSKTSQTCPCGVIIKKQLNNRVHYCGPDCPWNGWDRDIVAAIEIRRRSLQNSDVTVERVGSTRRKPRKAKHLPVGGVVSGNPHYASAPVSSQAPEGARNNQINTIQENFTEKEICFNSSQEVLANSSLSSTKQNPYEMGGASG